MTEFDLNMLALTTFTASFIAGWVNAAYGDPLGIARLISRLTK